MLSKKYTIACVFVVVLLFITSVAYSQTQSADEYFIRGANKSESGDYTGAIADLSKAIQLDPTDAKAYNNRGISKLLSGDTTGACIDLRKAQNLGDAKVTELIVQYCQ